jgi:hypothetical protein
MKEKDDRISELENVVAFYQEENETYKRTCERKVKAYEQILEM